MVSMFTWRSPSEKSAADQSGLAGNRTKVFVGSDPLTENIIDVFNDDAKTLTQFMQAVVLVICNYAYLT